MALIGAFLAFVHVFAFSMWRILSSISLLASALITWNLVKTVLNFIITNTGLLLTLIDVEALLTVTLIALIASAFKGTDGVLASGILIAVMSFLLAFINIFAIDTIARVAFYTITISDIVLDITFSVLVTFERLTSRVLAIDAFTNLGAVFVHAFFIHLPVCSI